MNLVAHSMRVNNNMAKVLLFALALWSICSPAHLNPSTSTTATPNEYDDYNEEDEGPGQINKAANSDHPHSTLMPYFEKNTTIVYAKLNKSVQLDCPVKNYNKDHHEVMWYKDQSPITNGKEAFQSFYHLETVLKLEIKSISNETAGFYSCHVMPGDIKRQITVIIGDPPKSPKTAAGSNTSRLSVPSFFFALALGSFLYSLKPIAKYPF